MNIIEKFILKLIIKKISANKGVIVMFDKFKESLQGKKTYLIAVSGILAVLIAWSNGSIETTEAIRGIIEAILAITIRSGIAKK